MPGMDRRSSPRRLASAALGVAVLACRFTGAPSGGVLRTGTWGGTDAGLMVTDSGAHLHVGCTEGSVVGRIGLDAAGDFDVAGRYNLTAFPVNRGVFLPARLTGRAGAAELSLTVTVDDTTTGRTVVLGPVHLELGREPHMAQCPICRVPPARF
jgi:hypothetical protein